jgi:transcriptional regulator with XRE-family HTH domain
MSSAKLAFGLRLRAHRERAGISHDTLAESLKVKRSLLAELERGDLSHWPSGIYRRGLFREYVKAIGLPSSQSLDEFNELFPEATESQSSTSARGGADVGRGAPLRLTLAEAPVPATTLLYRRVGKAAADLAAVLLLGSVGSVLTDAGYWTSSGIAALIWYPTMAIWEEAQVGRMVANRFFRPASTDGESPPRAVVDAVSGRGPDQRAVR